jgi:cysteine desulfurase
VTRLPVDSAGIVSLDELKKSIKPNTFLVSIMMVNNEVGTIQSIYEALKIVRHARKVNANASAGNSKYPLFHTDAAQALYEDINMEKLGVDLLTLDGSKVYGPRGIGCLYIRRSTPIEQIIYGGGQERGIRSGTENVPAIMGFAKALELLGAEHIKMGHFTQVKWSVGNARTLLTEKLKAIRPDITINGVESNADSRTAKASQASPHILNVSIPGIDNEFFVLQLDARGIACSTKSSCLRDIDESYVLRAMGADSKTSIRFSFGRWTKKSDINKAAKTIASILHHS